MPTPSRPLRSPAAFGWLPALALAVALPGCTAFERGVEQGDPPADRITGCPDLGGAYVLRPVTADGDPLPGVDPAKPAGLTGGLFSPRDRPGRGAGDLSNYVGVVVRSLGTYSLEMHFLFGHGNVMSELEAIRQYQRGRYEEWYALMQPDGRAAFVARHGEPALRSRLLELGPATGRVVVLDRNRDYTCEDGWVLLPRERLPPVRMTLDPGGNLVFESKEWTYSVWGGWGDQSLRVPTGAYLGTARWARDPAVRPWDPDEVAQQYVFARPPGQIEREQVDIAAQARRNAERRFAAPEVVHRALQPLLPQGISISEVSIVELPFLGPRVRVRAVPVDPGMDGEDQRRRLEWFLAALKEGDPGFIEDREVVKRVVVGSGRQRHEFEIHLDTHPSVQPGTAPRLAEAQGAAGVFVPPVPSSSTPVVASSPATAAVAVSDPVPAGFALLSEVESRLAPLLAEGCRSTALRYAGTVVIIDGEAADMPCVSNSLRAIDAVVAPSGARVELLQIAADGKGRYRFAIRLPESSLTKA